MDGPDEAHMRASIGRSYYAAYHESLEAADRLGLPVAGGSDKGIHARHIERFQGKGKTLAKIAGRLHLAKMKRVKADYMLNEHVGKADSQQQLIACQSLIADLERLGISKADISL